MLETLEQVRTREPVPVRLLQPKVPRDLETICLKCLLKEPRKRYPSAAALAHDLQHFLNGEPIQARRSRAWERAYLWVRRNPMVASLAALVVVAFLAGFGGVFWQWRKTQAALERAESSLYVQHVSLADREAQAGNTDRAEVLLDLCSPVLRHWEWHYLKRRCHANWLRLAGHTDLVRCVTCNADGTRLASCSNDGTVRVWDTASGRELLTLRHGGWVRAVVFHADGQRLVSASEDNTVKVWGATDGREIRRLTHAFSYAMSFSPDGRLFALLVHGKGLVVHEVESGQQATAVPGLPTDTHVIGFSPDSRRVVTNLDSRLRVWDARTGQQIHLLREGVPKTIALVFSPDGRRLFASLREDRYSALKVWDVTTGQEVPEVAEHTADCLCDRCEPGRPEHRHRRPGGHRQGSRHGGRQGSVRLADVPRSHHVPGVSTGWSGPGGGDGAHVWLRAWGGQKDRKPTVLQGHTGGVSCVAFTPDGSRLASCGENDQVKVWDVRSGQPIRSLTAPARVQCPGVQSRRAALAGDRAGRWRPLLGRQQRPARPVPARAEDGTHRDGLQPGRPAHRHGRRRPGGAGLGCGHRGGSPDLHRTRGQRLERGASVRTGAAWRQPAAMGQCASGMPRPAGRS